MHKGLVKIASQLRKFILRVSFLIIALSFMPFNVVPEFIDLLQGEVMEEVVPFPTAMEEEEEKKEKDNNGSKVNPTPPTLQENISNLDFYAFKVKSQYIKINTPPPKQYS